jgi:hypothetical protein
MFDVALTDTIASALANAWVGSIRADEVVIGAAAMASADPERVSRVCRRAARLLLCEMCGAEMLDLALAKLAAESELRVDVAAAARGPTH